jgi:cold shock CspA family protein
MCITMSAHHFHAFPAILPEYIGFVREYNSRRGFGFIICAETWMIYKHDVFLHRYQARRISAGDQVIFSIDLNARGQPQARNVRWASVEINLPLPICDLALHRIHSELAQRDVYLDRSLCGFLTEYHLGFLAGHRSSEAVADLLCTWLDLQQAGLPVQCLPSLSADDPSDLDMGVHSMPH